MSPIELHTKIVANTKLIFLCFVKFPTEVEQKSLIENKRSKEKKV